MGTILSTLRSLGVRLARLCRWANTLTMLFVLAIFICRPFNTSVSDQPVTTDTARMIASRLDYCNSLLYDVNAGTMAQLQRVQNIWRVLSVIFGHQSCWPARLTLSLHWHFLSTAILPTGTFNAARRQSPGFLWSGRTLRSANQSLLSLQPSRTVIAARRFSSPKIWNIRSASSLTGFKFELKTHLFHTAFNRSAINELRTSDF